MPRKIPFYDLQVSTAAQKAVAETLRSGWLTSGPAVARLEEEVGRLINVPHLAAVSSATAGITLALRAVGVEAQDEVITSPFSFVAGVESILNLGARPVLIDIDPGTLNLDPDKVERALTAKTAAILPVDIGGFPCDYAKLSRIAKKHGIPLVSDSAHALGATVNRKSIATYCDLSVFSFHATKNLTSGEGGMVASKNKKLIEIVRLQSKHGMTASAYERRKSGGWRYDVTTVGFKANMSDLLASVARGELKGFSINQQKRELLAMRYIANLAVVEDLLDLPHLKTGFQPAWHLFIVKLKLDRLTLDRDQVISSMAKAGIGCSVHYRPIHTMSFAQQIPGLRAKLPAAERAGRSVMSLPLYPLLKPSDVDRICRQLISILRRHTR